MRDIRISPKRMGEPCSVSVAHAVRCESAVPHFLARRFGAVIVKHNTITQCCCCERCRDRSYSASQPHKTPAERAKLLPATIKVALVFNRLVVRFHCRVGLVLVNAGASYCLCHHQHSLCNERVPHRNHNRAAVDPACICCCP